MEDDTEVVEKEVKGDLKKFFLADGLLPDKERGESTPLAPKPGADGPRAGQRKRGKKNKMQRLLKFQAELCETCGLPPSRLMRDAACSYQNVKRLGRIKKRRRINVKTTRRGKKTGGGEDGEKALTSPTFLPKALTSREYNLSMLWCSREEGLEQKVRREEGAPEPDAGLLSCQEEGEEGWRRREVGEAGFLPPFTGPVSASGNILPRTLRQVSVGDLVDGGIPGCGPEAT